MQKYGRIGTMTLVVILFVGAVWQWTMPSSPEGMDLDRIDGYLKTLRSGEMAERITGSPAYEQTISFIADTLDEAGVAVRRQAFTTPVAQVEQMPVIAGDQVETLLGKPIRMGQDYTLVSSPYSGSVAYEGDLLFIMENYFKMDPSLLEGKVLVTGFNVLTDDIIEYAIDQGALGILNSTFSYYGGVFNVQGLADMDQRVDWKHGKRIFIAQISDQVHTAMKAVAKEHLIEAYSNLDVAGVSGYIQPIVTGYVPDMRVAFEQTYPVRTVENVIATIPGKDASAPPLWITTHVDVEDVYGAEAHDGRADQGASVALLMELAQELKRANDLERTIHIGFIGGSVQGGMGYQAFYDSMGTVLPGMEVIHLGAIGSEGDNGLYYGSTRGWTDDRMWVLTTRLMGYGNDLGIPMLGTQVLEEEHVLKPLEAHDIPYVVLATGSAGGAPEADMRQVDMAGNLLRTYLYREVQGHWRPDYLPVDVAVVGTILAAALLLFGVVGEMARTRPGCVLFGRNIRAITYSTPFTLGAETAHFGVTIIVALVAMIGVLLIPQYFMMVDYGGTYSNFSLYLFGKNIVLFSQHLMQEGITVKGQSVNLLELLWSLSKNSAWLLGVSVAVAMVLGILKGLVDGYKPGMGKNMVSIILFSVPDVLVAFAGLYAMIYVMRIPGIEKVIEPELLRTRLFPVLALSIVPAVYISRIALVAVEEERHKGYLKGVVARGATQGQAYIRHIVPVMFLKILDSMPAVFKIMIANLLIVEFFYGYPGVANYLLSQMGDKRLVLFLAMGIGGFYLTFTVAFKGLAWLLNPMKRRGKRWNG